MRANVIKHQASLAAWSEHVRDCRSSGMSVRAWCRERGMTTTTYYKWERQVLKESEPRDTTRNLPAPVFAKLPEADTVAVLCRVLSHAE